MIKPVKKVHIEKSLIPGTYYIETRDESVFKYLEEFGTVSLGSDLGNNNTRWFDPSKLYDPDDIKDMLDSLDKTPSSFIQKATEMVKELKECGGKTIRTMRVWQKGYTLPWAYDGHVLNWDYEVTQKKHGTCDMPITRISSDTWEVEPAKSDFWQVVCVKKR